MIRNGLISDLDEIFIGVTAGSMTISRKSSGESAPCATIDIRGSVRDDYAHGYCVDLWPNVGDELPPEPGPRPAQQASCRRSGVSSIALLDSFVLLETTFWRFLEAHR